MASNGHCEWEPIGSVHSLRAKTVLHLSQDVLLLDLPLLVVFFFLPCLLPPLFPLSLQSALIYLRLLSRSQLVCGSFNFSQWL